MAETFAAETFTTDVQGLTGFGLRSDEVEVVIIPDVGAKVYSLRNRRTGREWMWSPPDARKLYPVPTGTPFDASTLIGADECLPTIAPTTWRGRNLPDHGEVWNLVWDLDRLAWTQGRIVTRIELPVSPFWFERTVTLEGNRVTFSYALRNLDFGPQEFMWAFHPLMRIAEGDQIRLSPDCRQVRTEAAMNVPLGRRGDLWSWPAPMPGIALDQMHLGENAAVKLFTEPRDAVWASIYNEQTQEELRFDFDSRLVDTLGIWITRGGWNGYHHVALEPGIGAPDALDAAVQDWRRFELVMPNETRRWRFTVTVV